MAKFDVKKEGHYRAKLGVFDLIEIPEQTYLTIDGTGDPNTAREYQDAVSALYPIAYGMKFASKKDLDRDYVVPPLEGLWCADDMESFTSRRSKDEWRWTMMIMTPHWITTDMFTQAQAKAMSKKDASPRIGDVRMVGLSEGLVVQTLHIGPYDEEGPIIAAMHEHAYSQGLTLAGKHHEIYLGDPRRTASEKLKTILRQPVKQPQ